MKPRFPPTFKVTRHTPEHVYEQKRIPSYCDRVLWSALSGFLPRVTVREYTSDPTFDTSDHKPVKCTVTTTVPRPGVFQPPVNTYSRVCSACVIHSGAVCVFLTQCSFSARLRLASLLVLPV